MDAVFVEDTLKEYRDETDSQLNNSLSKLQQQQDSFQTELLTIIKGGMTPQPSSDDVHGQYIQPADPVRPGVMNTICSNPLPPTPVNNGATIANAPINASDTPPEHHGSTHGTPQAAIYHASPLQRPEFHCRMSQASWRTTVAN